MEKGLWWPDQGTDQASQHLPQLPSSHLTFVKKDPWGFRTVDKTSPPLTPWPPSAQINGRAQQLQTGPVLPRVYTAIDRNENWEPTPSQSNTHNPTMFITLGIIKTNLIMSFIPPSHQLPEKPQTSRSSLSLPGSGGSAATPGPPATPHPSYLL